MTPAGLAYKKRRAERERSGPGYFPTEPVATHLRHLLANGWTQVAISGHSGIGRRTIHSIVCNPRPTVYRSTAEPLLALPVRVPTGRVLAVGSARRVQGLAAIGWSVAWTTRQTGLHPQFFRDLVSGRLRRVPSGHAIAIERLCRAYYLTPGPSKAARTVAAKNGWVPVTSWEDIDDPTCAPEHPKTPRSGL